ncbi:tyrosinase family protein [Moorena producens]|uniref:tyrosinase family protein n=1 Tax=Moorena producens TaxID=1155739 RepID=UPI001314B9D6|nr:tyrosinase family protein [Moorena producens]
MSVSTLTGEAVALVSEEATAGTSTITRDPHIRYSATSPQGKENLKSFQQALNVMRDMDCTDPRSWYYQGAIHWVPTKPENISGITQENPLCPYYSEFSDSDPATSKLLESWNNCTHDKNQAGVDPKIHFLPWHRLYLHHFEKIVRDLSEDPNFSLPYWDYISYSDTEVPDQERLEMPLEFYEPNIEYDPDPAGNSLYESGRACDLNMGEPISDNFAVADLVNAVEDLNREQIFEEFSNAIEQAPHNRMHKYIGGGEMEPDEADDCNIFNRIYNRDLKDDQTPQLGLMRSIPSAGFDPIFWLHHANIDRLWSQWTNKKDIYVAPEELQKVSWPYQFFEPDGEVIGYTMDEVVEAVYSMDYDYDDGYRLTWNIPATYNLDLQGIANQRPKKPLKKLLGFKLAQKALGGSAQEFTLRLRLGSSLRDKLKEILLPNEPNEKSSLQLKDIIKSASQERLSKLNFILEVNVIYTGEPEGTYSVYLNLPKDEKTKKTAIADIDTYFLGNISFFVLSSDRQTSKTFQFEISDELLRQIEMLDEDEFDPDSISISIRKKGRPVNDDIIVDSIAIYSRD